MPRAMCLAAAALFGLILPAGCPVDPAGPAQTTTTSGGDPATSSEPADTSGDGTSQDTAAAADSLAEQFPGCSEPANADAWRTQVWQLLNNERTRDLLEPLARNEVLDAEAEQYACEMIYYDFFAHENPVTDTTLADRAASFGYEYWMIGENLAAGQRSPDEVVQAWMNSPGHRENMLNDRFTEVGVGFRSGGDYGLYWVLEFGEPR